MCVCALVHSRRRRGKMRRISSQLLFNCSTVQLFNCWTMNKQIRKTKWERTRLSLVIHSSWYRQENGPTKRGLLLLLLLLFKFPYEFVYLLVAGCAHPSICLLLRPYSSFWSQSLVFRLFRLLVQQLQLCLVDGWMDGWMTQLTHQQQMDRGHGGTMTKSISSSIPFRHPFPSQLCSLSFSFSFSSAVDLVYQEYTILSSFIPLLLLLCRRRRRLQCKWDLFLLLLFLTY